jgi:ATP-dependent helicase/nuclease subunit A
MSVTFDADARLRAVDPSRNVVLEASAGTGKTRVLVERYVNLLLAGVAPEHILAITFTRKAAAEMRQRIVERLKEASRTGQLPPARWKALRERLGEIAISTIDAFCLSLIREFPLEADVEPGFDLADGTEIPRLIAEALDRALRICRHQAQTDADIALVFLQLNDRKLREGLTALLGRRLVAAEVLQNFLASGPRDLTPEVACRRAAERLADILLHAPADADLDTLLIGGPVGHPQFAMLAADLRSLCSPPAPDYARPDVQAAFRMLVDRVRGYFLTLDGKPRKAKGFGQADVKKEHCVSETAWKRHRDAVEIVAPAIEETVRAFRRDLNVILSRGVWRLFQVALSQYRRTLDAHAVLDFSEVLSRAVGLLRQMEEFSQSRYRLEARFQHVLVDELQDTNRAQWELVALLVRSWGEGFGASADALAPSIFVVGDRKQSIYGFRDAEVAVLDEAVGFIGGLRRDDATRQAISVSFRAVPGLLAFVNELFVEIAGTTDGARRDAFRYADDDRFPVVPVVDAELPLFAAAASVHDVVDILAGATVEATTDRVADEVVRLLSPDSGAVVRDPRTGVARPVRAADIAVLFRSRDSHRDYEAALDRRQVPTYVYKGLGFFDADEIQDLIALLRFLADPTSDLRAAAFLRSRIVRVSDRGIVLLGRRLADALTATEPPPEIDQLEEEDRGVLERVRRALPHWLAMVDRLPPSEVLEEVLRETAYALEMRGSRRPQARENVKKLRSLIRRVENRGYATLVRIADFLDDLAVGDESNAVVDAADAVSLMTVHAAKGLEFPIVFIVNMQRGAGGPRAPVRVLTDGYGVPSVSIGDFESEADEDTTARDREETKRLLYVAATRARDRLYFAAALKDGAFKPGRGSLGEVLPKSFAARFEAAVVSPRSL